MPRSFRKLTSDEVVEQAERLLALGEMSRACRLLLSKGMADTANPDITAQMREKHPERAANLDAYVHDLRNAPELDLSMDMYLRRLRKNVGVGVVGPRNEHLRALTRDVRAVDAYSEYANAFANGRLPDWYYYVTSTGLLCGLVKKEAALPNDQPDVRPIGMGSCDTRCIISAAMADMRADFNAHFWPQQVGCGVKGGAGMVVHAVRETVQRNPGFVVVKTDFDNRFNRVHRRAILRAVLDAPREKEMFIRISGPL